MLMSTFLHVFLNQDLQQITNSIVYLLIKIQARICQNNMFAYFKSYSDNASVYVNMQRTSLWCMQITDFVLELVQNFYIT